MHMPCVISGLNLTCCSHLSRHPGLSQKFELSEDSPPPGALSLLFAFFSPHGSWHFLATHRFPFSCGLSSYLQSVSLHLAEESLPLNTVLGFLCMQRTFARSPAAFGPLPPSLGLHFRISTTGIDSLEGDLLLLGHEASFMRGETEWESPGDS